MGRAYTHWLLPLNPFLAPSLESPEDPYQHRFVLNKELWFTAFYVSSWRSTIHITGTNYSVLSADDTPPQLSHLHISFIPSFSPLPLLTWLWPKGMILRTPPLTITTLNIERMKSIPFAFKKENVCWLGIYQDKKNT